MGFAICFAGLANYLALRANKLGNPAVWYTALGNGVAGLVNGLAEITIRLVTLAIWFIRFGI